jgi:hypothetical protein
MKKNHSWIARSLAAILCAGLIATSFPRRAQADIIEYSLLLTIILTVVAGAIPAGVPPQPWQIHGLQLQDAVNAAQQANSAGERSKEIGRLGKANGIASAMLSEATTSCNPACGDVTQNLQAIIGYVGFLQSLAIGTVTASCNPDGVVEPGEECDPLAVPTGCASSTVPTFCDTECLCEQGGIPATTP